MHHFPATDDSARPPLLFVHGAWHGAWCWQDGFIDHLNQQGFDCYAIDLRGHGESEATKPMRWNRIADYVEENNIDRPQDMVIKSIVNKSGLKVYIIQSTDRKLPLEDIASAKGLDMPKLISEMENIVYSGTKVNINYYLDEILEIEQQDEIFDYFKGDAETDSIEEAMKEFEEEYDEEELRLMRIKFLSEYAN